MGQLAACVAEAFERIKEEEKERERESLGAGERETMPPSIHDMGQQQTSASSIHRSTAAATATATHAAGSKPILMPTKSRVTATSGYALSSGSHLGSPLPKQSNGTWIGGVSPEARLGLKHMRDYESPASSKVRAFVYELND